MPHRTRILDGDNEYLVADEPGPTGAPVLRLFTRAGNQDFTLPGGLPEFTTEQGNWLPLAVVEDDAIRLADGAIEGPLERLGLLVRRYRHERAEQVRRSSPPYWYLLVRGRPHGVVHEVQPGGLLLLLFRQEEEAEAALRDLGLEGSVASAGALGEFLAIHAEEGYAGALLDHHEPVFWCQDPSGQLCFLKLSSVAGTDEFEGHLLGDRGQWRPFEGREDLEFVDDQDRWDELMARSLGAVPFLGYASGFPVYALLDGGQMVFLEEEDAARTLPLFHQREAAESFAAQHDVSGAEVVEIQDLRGLLRDAADHGAVARLHPEDHRARGGALWMDGREVVLDSFSGFWRSSDLRTFDRVP